MIFTLPELPTLVLPIFNVMEMQGFCGIVCTSENVIYGNSADKTLDVDTSFPGQSNLENTYYLGYNTPTSPDHPGIPDQGISLQYREPFGETYHNGWGIDPRSITG